VDLHSHLIVEHGYLRLDDSLLPRSIALSSLWERVFESGAPRAHEQLFRILGNGYAVALEAELLQRLAADPAAPKRLVSNLRASVVVRAHFWPLVSSEHFRIRSLGRDLILLDLHEALQNDNLAVSDVRRLVDRLCPKDDTWEKIRVSERLARFSSVSPAVLECRRQLQAERPVACPECGMPLAPTLLEAHILQVHPSKDFRALSQSPEEAFAARLKEFCFFPDARSWLALVQIAREQTGTDGLEFVAGQMVNVLEKESSNRRLKALHAIAPVIADSGIAGSMIRAFISENTATAGLMAMVIAIRLGAPIERGLMQSLLPQLHRKRAPAAIQIAASAIFLASTQGDKAVEREIVEALTARRRKSRALYRLQELEKITGPIASVRELIEELEARVRVLCPRCSKGFYRPEMSKHLWEVHRLVLDGKRVRKPWRQIERWMRDYQKTGRPDLLERCLAIGDSTAGVDGRLRVARLFMLRGIKHERAAGELLSRARDRQVSLCPRCFKRVPVPGEQLPRAMNESHGRLSLAGYYSEVSSYGFVPKVTLESPHAVIRSGRESKRFLTAIGVITFLVTPLATFAFLAACAFYAMGLHGEWLIAPILGGVFLAYLATNLKFPGSPTDLDRSVDMAWQELAPQVRRRGFFEEDATFLAGLALSSLGRGTRELREGSLARSISLMERAVSRGKISVSYLAALVRIRLADLAALGEDPLPALCQEVTRSFTRELPLSYAQHLLEGWKGNWWTEGNKARLRVLLCDQAFEAGLELSDLLHAARQTPALAAILEVNQVERLAQLRLLWSMRARCPWVEWGNFATVFDLAREPATESLMVASPDLLLAERGPSGMRLLGRGVLFQNVLFARQPRELSIKSVRDQSTQQICIDDRRFSLAEDSGPVLRKLERCFRFYFQEFAVNLPLVHTWHSPTGNQPLSLHAAVRCPSCRCRLIPTIGQVGTLQEHPKGRAIDQP
jgi:hypothetical protein